MAVVVRRFPALVLVCWTSELHLSLNAMAARVTAIITIRKQVSGWLRLRTISNLQNPSRSVLNTAKIFSVYLDAKSAYVNSGKTGYAYFVLFQFTTVCYLLIKLLGVTHNCHLDL